jgi:hypothetical protein
MVKWRRWRTALFRTFAPPPRFEMLTAAVRDRLAPLTRLLALAVAGALAGCVSQPGDEVAGKQGEVIDVCASAPEGALCDDGNICTIFDVCKAGMCKGSMAPNGTLCTDGNTCTTNDSCRGGMCKGDQAPNTTACNDGDPCTVGDSCMAGSCIAGAGTLACNDGVACTLDLCVAGFGCVFSPTGDCNPPKDAGADAVDAADAKTDVAPEVMPVDAADALMSIDVAADKAADVVSPADVASPSDKADVVSPVDVTPPVDLGAPETPKIDAPADKGGAETGVEVGMEVGVEAGPPDAGTDAGEGGVDAEIDAAVDAAEDARPDAADARQDADAQMEVGTLPALPTLHASGGACNCNAAPSPSDPVLVLVLVLVLVAVLEARRRPET